MLNNVKGLEFKGAQKALEMLIGDRNEELVELAESMGISTKNKGWEEVLFRTCLYFNEYLKYLMEPKSAEKTPYDEGIHKTMTLIRKVVNSEFVRKRQLGEENFHKVL